jgi:3-hydroxyisobutyrate dehydrogenase-like beta-hydroxyacid dehydrogenase
MPRESPTSRTGLAAGLALAPGPLALDALVADALVADALVADALVADALVADALVADALVADAGTLSPEAARTIAARALRAAGGTACPVSRGDERIDLLKRKGLKRGCGETFPACNLFMEALTSVYRAAT